MPKLSRTQSLPEKADGMPHFRPASSQTTCDLPQITCDLPQITRQRRRTMCDLSQTTSDLPQITRYLPRFKSKWRRIKRHSKRLKVGRSFGPLPQRFPLIGRKSLQLNALLVCLRFHVLETRFEFEVDIA